MIRAPLTFIAYGDTRFINTAWRNAGRAAAIAEGGKRKAGSDFYRGRSRL